MQLPILTVYFRVFLMLQDKRLLMMLHSSQYLFCLLKTINKLNCRLSTSQAQERDKCCTCIVI